MREGRHSRDGRSFHLLHLRTLIRLRIQQRTQALQLALPGQQRPQAIAADQ
jgi:hypothetical protein